jgi:hypothetical protein
MLVDEVAHWPQPGYSAVSDQGVRAEHAAGLGDYLRLMTAKTAVGGDFGDDWGSWLALLVALGGLGIAPKSWRPALGAAGTALTIYKLLKWLGWL